MAGIIATPQNMGGAEIPFYEYGIDYSCRFNDDDSAALDNGGATAMDDYKIYTLSVWVKRCNLGIDATIIQGGADVNNNTFIRFNASDKIDWVHYDGGGVEHRLITTALYRDTTNWYHLFFRYDSTDGTAGDRQRMWVNGTEVTAFDTDDTPALNKTCDLGGSLLNVGCRVSNSLYMDGYMAEMYFIDATAMAVTSFGKFKNGVWVPIEISPTYGAAGFYLDFANSSDFGSDQSGNANDFTDVNLAVGDQVVDTPTENHCILNVLDKSLSGATLAEGSLKVTLGAAADGVRGTHAIPETGKWYFELICSNSGFYGGICNQDFALDGDTGDDADACTFLDNSTVAYVESANQVGYWAANPAGNAVGVCVNMDDLEIHFTNAAEGEQANVGFGATAGDIWFPYGGGNSDNATFDFGQSGFTLTPPIGYLALNTTNIALKNAYSSDVMNPTSGFETVLYTGDDGATQAITGANHQPNLVWIKNRSQADSHYLCDSIRGATNWLEPDTTDVEATDANDGVSSFDTDGFTVMFNALDITNANGENYVAWCWLKNAAYGFDIQTYTGTGSAHAENHDLGGTPELIITKERTNDAGSWYVYHNAALNKTDPETDFGQLQGTDAWADNIVVWNDTVPTSTQFTVGTDDDVNGNTDTYVAYLWRSIEGFSKVFSYEGNNNADGPFVYCGFRPKFVLVKNADAVQSWIIFDSIRTTHNEIDDMLYPDAASAEGTGTDETDFLSNGFKLRSADSRTNDAVTYVGIVFSETPGIYSNAR